MGSNPAGGRGCLSLVFIACCVCVCVCVCVCGGLCDGMVTGSEVSYLVDVCVCVCVCVCLIVRDLNTLKKTRWPRPNMGCRATESKLIIY